jgi:predicted  nucleic acid-binding Zn-ribbon protein
MINPELMVLLEIQDLTSKMRELEVEPGIQELEREHFQVDAPDAVRQLSEKIHEMEDQLEPAVRRRYDRIVGRMERVVVPVINGVCYGCFTSIAVSVAAEHGPRMGLETCENCGRFIYVLP